MERLQVCRAGGQVGGIINYTTMDGIRMFVRRLPEAIGWFEQWLTPGGFIATTILAAFGLVILARRDWCLALCVAIGFLVPIYPTLTVPINDTAHYLLISVWLLLFVAAVALNAIVTTTFDQLKHRAFRLTFKKIVEAAIILMPLLLMRHNWKAADDHNYHEGKALVRSVFDRVAPNAVVFCWWGPSNALWYAHYVEHMRPDVDVYDDSSALDNGWGGVVPAIARFFPKRPVYSLPIGNEIDAKKKFTGFESSATYTPLVRRCIK